MPKQKNTASKVSSASKTKSGMKAKILDSVSKKINKKTAPAMGGMKEKSEKVKARRFRPGTVALREIKRY